MVVSNPPHLGFSGKAEAMMGSNSGGHVVSKVSVNEPFFMGETKGEAEVDGIR